MLEEPTGNQDEIPTTIPHWYDPDGSPLTLESGDGATVVDDEGEKYLDFASQLYCVNAGHGNQQIIDAMTEQLAQIQYVSSSKHSPVRSELGERLVEIAPGDFSNVMFSVTGSEANELAVQIARNHTGGSKILTRWRSYHGSTYGAGSLSGDPETRALVESHAATTGSAKFLPPMSHPSPFNADSPEELAELAADHLDFVIRNEDPDSIAAIMMEPVAGSSGGYPAPPGYFARVRELCDKYDILLIADEVITGFGRCGEWFGIETEDVEPDMITFAKGVTSSYAPLAGVLVRPELISGVQEDGFDLGQTFGGHPVGCAAALAAIDVYEDSQIDNVRENASLFEDGLAELESQYDVVADTRGRGYLWGVAFEDPETGEPFYDPRVDSDDEENPVWDVISTLEDRGVLVGIGRPATQILLSPPLCTTAEEIETVLDALDAAVADVF
ncbi:class III aminotransferase [Natrialba chahannaoensis JCM 10990]|uniref:Class III aminotransferase n=1 Tax=Natrialba chahannaoensis JCM 10990 TaxID=1227492 RepID=M0A8R3_9EURY|nr:aspartate aminotransferase family protein [Natrialba chahannaoensis]ELY94282.1 class III aminotransferase [Natrialba chahannaoensis JCM 10990]